MNTLQAEKFPDEKDTKAGFQVRLQILSDLLIQAAESTAEDPAVTPLLLRAAKLHLDVLLSEAAEWTKPQLGSSKT